MAKEERLFSEQKQKLSGVCEENHMTYRFNKDTYPITLTIRPVADMDAQMDMLANVEDKGYISPDAFITFMFMDGGITRKYGGGQFTITDTLQGKIERIFRKMCSYWQQFFFMDIVQDQKLVKALMPYVPDDTKDTLPAEALPLETFDDDDLPEEDWEIPSGE